MMEDEPHPPGVHTEFRTFGFSTAALRPVYELNRELIAAMIESARRPSHELRIGLAVELGDLLSELEDDDIQRLAASPICLLDAGFNDDKRWREVAMNAESPSSIAPSGVEFPRLQALQWSQLLFVLAWTVARSSPECARMIFGLSPQCGRTLSGMVLQSVQQLAERNSHWLKPRWGDRSGVWRRLIATARQSATARVPNVGVRAMLQLLADLEPATGVRNETRSGLR